MVLVSTDSTERLTRMRPTRPEVHALPFLPFVQTWPEHQTNSQSCSKGCPALSSTRATIFTNQSPAHLPDWHAWWRRADQHERS